VWTDVELWRIVDTSYRADSGFRGGNATEHSDLGPTDDRPRTVDAILGDRKVQRWVE
jgi:hypothetical protein